MMPKVDVSFKKTSRDMKLYLALIGHEEKSDYAKDAMEFYEKYKKYEAEIALLVKELQFEK